MSRRLFTLAAVALALMVGPLAAQEKFPSRPITIIVPTPPGGGVDIVHRLLAELAEPTLGVKVVIENKPGASGSLGLAALANAKNDGYTLAAVWNAPLTITPHALQVPYDVADFAPIIQTTGGTPLIYCVRPDFPANSGKEFIAYAKENPGKLTYGTDGVGAMVQLSGERLFQPLGLKLRPVPFGGAGETLKNFLGGHVDIYGGTIPPIEAQLKDGKAKCLITTAKNKLASLPQAASASEVGLPNESTDLWRGLIAPKGTPADRVKLLADAFRKAAAEPKFKEYLTRTGETAVVGTPEDFQKVITAEYAAFGGVIKSIGLQKK
jgi:tripartite-type tricarboxylate transporter receptor subunit TctC